MYKEDLGINNLQWLICQTEPNSYTFMQFYFMYIHVYFFITEVLYVFTKPLSRG